MKSLREIALVATLMMLTTALSAQVSIGLKGGYYQSNIQKTEGLESVTPDFFALDNYTIGAVAEVPIFSNFYFQSELNYTVKGFGVTANANIDVFNTSLPLGGKARSKFHYLDVPLLAKAKFGQQAVQLYLMAGPSFGYALSGEVETRVKALVELKVSDISIDLDDIDYERFELSGIVGAGMNIDLNAVQLFADARYQHGFTELYDIPYAEEKVRNKGLALTAGFMIPIK